MSVSNVTFDQNNPFPLVGVSALTYREAQGHADEVDSWLGLRTSEIENQLTDHNSDQELWIGLPIQALLTPYTEFRQVLEKLNLKAGSTVIDCGAGYGRMGFVISRHFPHVKFIGFEIVPDRVAEGQRCLEAQGCKSAQMVCANIDSDEFDLPEAEAYFVYDFSHRSAIDRLLLRLQGIALRNPITVVARGRSSRDAIDHEHPWLSQVVAPEHYANFSIYRSR